MILPIGAPNPPQLRPGGKDSPTLGFNTKGNLFVCNFIPGNPTLDNQNLCNHSLANPTLGDLTYDDASLWNLTYIGVFLPGVFYPWTIIPLFTGPWIGKSFPKVQIFCFISKFWPMIVYYVKIQLMVFCCKSKFVVITNFAGNFFVEKSCPCNICAKFHILCRIGHVNFKMCQTLCTKKISLNMLVQYNHTFCKVH